jgi:hypothetical protein
MQSCATSHGVSDMRDRRATNEAAFHLLSDALSSVTRASRRNVIILSTICFVVSKTGVNPSDLSVPFFKFQDLSEQFIVLGLYAFLIISYLSFLANATSDYFRFKHQSDRYNFEVAFDIDSAMAGPPDEHQDHSEREFEIDTGYKPFSIPHGVTKAIRCVKTIMDFIFPVIFGLISILVFGCAVVFR